MTRRLTAWCLGIVLLALAGCGFGLRQPVHFAFASLYCAVDPTSNLGIELRRQLLSSGELQFYTDAAQQAQSEVVLEILSELRTKTVVGVSTTGQVREFQLRLNLKFRLRTPLGKELIPETELVQQRSMSYSEAYALAKETEEALLYRNMQSDMVQQILRRLAAVKTS